MVSWEWWTQSTTVYMKISAKHALFYIGSTEYDVFHREQTRVRKYRQLETDRLAYFEPALKLWHHFQDFHEFAIFPVKHCDVHQLQSEESSLQYVLRPEHNSPWINPQLKKLELANSYMVRLQPTLTFIRQPSGYDDTAFVLHNFDLI